MSKQRITLTGLSLLMSVFLCAAFANAANAKKATNAANAESKKKKTNKTKRPTASQQLKREIVFDGSTVGGQYHSAGEAVARVEQEKKMNDLIGMRHDFKDRMAAERERLKRGEAVAAD